MVPDVRPLYSIAKKWWDFSFLSSRFAKFWSGVLLTGECDMDQCDWLAGERCICTLSQLFSGRKKISEALSSQIILWKRTITRKFLSSCNNKLWSRACPISSWGVYCCEMFVMPRILKTNSQRIKHVHLNVKYDIVILNLSGGCLRGKCRVRKIPSSGDLV